jgi:hypothetical protein
MADNKDTYPPSNPGGCPGGLDDFPTQASVDRLTCVLTRLLEEFDRRSNARADAATSGSAAGGADVNIIDSHLPPGATVFFGAKPSTDPRREALDRQYGAVLVNYADDFVMLCRHGAVEVLKTTRRWMAGIGLALNEDKTRLRDARCDAFDFLGL